MTESEINTEAYRLVQLLVVSRDKPLEKQKRVGGSLSHLEATVTLKPIVGPIFRHALSPDHSTAKIQVKLNEYYYGFSDNDYPKFSTLLAALIDLREFKDTISHDFIQSKTILWLANVYEQKKASVDLVNFIRNETESEVEIQTVYFPVTNLHISRPFNIGKVELMYFTKEYFDEMWKRCKKEDTTEQQFNGLYRKYQGRVFASYTLRAESKKAKEIGLSHCALAVDILKLFSPTLFYPKEQCLIGIESKLNFNFQADAISIPKKDEWNWRISFSAQNDPFILDEDMTANLRRAGIDLFSRFIVIQEKNDLGKLIEQGISMASAAISNFDLHFRTAQLITVLESLLLEEDRKYDMEKKSKQRVASLFKNDPTPIIDANISELLHAMYQIRHKIIHKALRLPIDEKDLRTFQILVVEILKRLTIANRNTETKESLIRKLDQHS